MTDKKPVVVPWGDTICDQCYTALDDPQNKDVLICPQDGETYDRPAKKIYNRKIVTSLEQMLQVFNIVCSEHPDLPADLYCL